MPPRGGYRPPNLPGLAVPMTATAPPVRRSGSQKRQRTHLVQIRCTAAEHAQLQEAAERAGLTIGAFVRQRCLGSAGPRAVRRPPVERAALAQLLAQLGKCGSNLNQIARVLNSGGDTPSDITAAIDDFRAAVGDIMQVMGRAPHDH